MDLHNQLQLIGLPKSEINIYLFLLENGFSTPSQVSRGTKITRTNCYHVLQSLYEKGLIEERLNKKHKIYLATNPESLMRNWQKKKEIIEQLIPDLQNIYTVQKNKPKIRFYDGVEEIKEIYLQSLQSDHILAFGTNYHIKYLLPDFFKYYFNELKKRKVVYKEQITIDSQPLNKATQNELKFLYEFKILPKEYQAPPTNILVWGNNIAFLNFKEPAFGTIITNEFIAQTFKIVLSIIWNK